MISIATQLDASRKALLDLSTRNRLIAIPRQRKTAKIIEIKDELSPEIYRLLVEEGKALSFLPSKEKQKVTDEKLDEEEIDDFGELPQPEDDEIDERGVPKRHGDLRLQTLLTSEELQKRLLTMYYDSKTFEEEQGVNILYLAIGMLKWFEDDNSNTERYAPLILVPVELERGSAAERFKLSWRKEECAANLSLQAKMNTEFGLKIPDLPEDDAFDVGAYMHVVRTAVAPKTRFAVFENEMVLGFFSFAKFLMYRDLDPLNWPDNAKLDAHPLIAGLIRDGFPAAEGMIGEDENVDRHLTPAQMLHVVDADGSQTLAIEEVRRGRNLVIQGPPGTGKSQTITNIIASAIADGKKVLFVAEKMAALEVVHRRMEQIDLGALCLELHSHKVNKRAVLEELKRAKNLDRPSGHNSDHAATKLVALRDTLNAHAAVLHTPLHPSGFTAFQIIGHSIRLKEVDIEARDIVLEQPESWSPEDKREREMILSDVVARIKEMGSPAQHFWRGVSCPSLLPSEYNRLCDDLAKLHQLYEGVMEHIEALERAFPVTDTSLNSLYLVETIARSVISLPKADYPVYPVLAHPLWKNGLPFLTELVQNGARYSELKKKLSEIVIDAAWDTDLTECRQQLAMHGKSILRFLKPSYRQSVALLKSFLTVPLPKAHSERLELIDSLIATQKLEKFLEEQYEIGANTFGCLWKGVRSDWIALTALVTWRNNLPMERLPEDFLTHCARITAPAEWEERADHLQKLVKEFFSKLDALFKGLQLDMQVAFCTDKVEAIQRDVWYKQLSNWIETSETLSKWIAFKGRYDTLCAKGLRAIAEKLFNGDIPVDKALAVFECAYFDVLAEIIFTAYPQLREFDGDQHDLLVSNFRDIDNYHIEQTRIAICAKHYNDMPCNEGGIGALGVLNGEFAKKRNHLPIRQLMRRAGPAIQALKPVFMMSPLSVAQFLEPGSLQFDLLVIDEASQVEPVDALGAIARARQVVVVGDTRQLPPTRFFSRMTGNFDEDVEDDESTLATHDVESILNLCLARGLPQRMLRWHYRSKHQSLIAVSNREFYDSKLFIVPSPYDAASGMGLKFNYLPHAVFDSGGTATNPIEAKAVAQAVIQHVKEYSNLSLGVGAFSVKQRQAILDELELLRRAHPETEDFFTQAHYDEPFFVKNLENIQGDERDVIFISVGYGRNQNGYLAMRFGPLSAEGGERRLNVLISRAKRRCEVFSSIIADDIDLVRAKGAGVAAFKLFLKFAQTGKLDFGRITDREADSVFEEQVAAALRSRGYDTKTQIGIAGFFIDIAVADPERPGRFVLGIECDGAAYHSSRSARDRDRLRQAVLEDHGWIIHRIWSTDWFYRPDEQLDRVIFAIEQAKKTLALQDRQQEESNLQQTYGIVSHGAGGVATQHVSVGAKRSLSIPYQEAILSVPKHVEPHEVTDQDMAAIVVKIVETENPVHENEIITRVRMLWNLARAGGRIQAKVKAGLVHAVRCGIIVQEGEFYLKSEVDVRVRDRSDVSSSGLRKPEYLPPHEIRKAILVLVETNFGASREQLPSEVARLLGFKSTSAQLREIIELQIQELLRGGKLQETGNHLTKIKNVLQYGRGNELRENISESI